jgi:hypothetical protein
MTTFDLVSDDDDFEVEAARIAALRSEAPRLDSLRVRPYRLESLYAEYSDTGSGIPCPSPPPVFSPLLFQWTSEPEFRSAVPKPHNMPLISMELQFLRRAIILLW